MYELLDVAVALLAGLMVGKLMNRFKIPLVAGYVLAGLILGQSFIGLLNGKFLNETSFIGDLALGFIAFSIGEELKLKNILKMGKSILFIAFFEAFAAFLLVTLGLLAFGQPLPTALLLGAVASATAPAATVMVIQEIRSKGPVTKTLLAVVAIDDAICLMIFAVASSFAKIALLPGQSVSFLTSLGAPVLEIGGSLLFGAVLGLILSFLIARAKNTQEILILEVGFIALSIGLTQIIHLSPLLTNMAVGTILANVSAKRRQAFETVGAFVPPIYTVFFVLAGARLDIHLLPQIGWIGFAYVMLRIAGKIGGSALGAVLSRAEPVVRKYIGLGLLSQIGVAIGLAIVIGREFPGTQLGNFIITILLATTIITEIVGPICTRIALMRAGEAGQASG